jgi:hypothetical protein
MQNGKIADCYLIVSVANNYVHHVFSTLGAANRWIERYNAETPNGRTPYKVVARYLYTNAADASL